MIEKTQIRARGYAVMPHAVYEHLVACQVGPYAIAVWVALNRYAHATDREAWPALRRIENDLGVSRYTVKKAIKALEACGALKVERQHDQHGGQRTNVYTLLDTVNGGSEHGSSDAPHERDTTSPVVDGEALIRRVATDESQGGGCHTTGGGLPHNRGGVATRPRTRISKQESVNKHTIRTSDRAEHGGELAPAPARPTAMPDGSDGPDGNSRRSAPERKARPDDPLYEAIMLHGFEIARDDEPARRAMNGRAVRAIKDLTALLPGYTRDSRAALAEELIRMYKWHAQQRRDGERLEPPVSGASIWRTLKRYRAAEDDSSEDDDPVMAEIQRQKANPADPDCQQCAGMGFYREATMPDGTTKIYGGWPPDGCVNTREVACPCVTQSRA